MTVVRWDPVREIAAYQERMSRALEGLYAQPQEELAPGPWVPAVDIYTNDKRELVLKAELSDVNQEDIELTIEDNTLTLRGERKFDTDVTKDEFHRIERSFGSFTRTFVLPPTVDAGKVSAQYKGGVLKVLLPLREEAKPRQIKVQVAA